MRPGPFPNRHGVLTERNHVASYGLAETNEVPDAYRCPTCPYRLVGSVWVGAAPEAGLPNPAPSSPPAHLATGSHRLARSAADILRDVGADGIPPAATHRDRKLPPRSHATQMPTDLTPTAGRSAQDPARPARRRPAAGQAAVTANAGALCGGRLPCGPGRCRPAKPSVGQRALRQSPARPGRRSPRPLLGPPWLACPRPRPIRRGCRRRPSMPAIPDGWIRKTGSPTDAIADRPGRRDG